jgi:ABC-2 type transport system permease protein
MIVTEKPLVQRVGFFSDTWTIARRAIRSLLREPEFIGPALAIPIFFFVVNIGALEAFVERQAGIDYRAFQLPVGIVFAVTGISRANMLVTDIQTGYLDRMLVTPIRRVSLLLGLMIADVVLALALATVVLLLGFAVGCELWYRCGGTRYIRYSRDGMEPCVHRVSLHGCPEDR